MASTPAASSSVTGMVCLACNDVMTTVSGWVTHRQGGFIDPFGHKWSVGDASPLRAARG